MSLNELIPQGHAGKKFKHRRTQSNSEQEIHKFGMAPKLVTEPSEVSSVGQFPTANETQVLLQLMQQKPNQVISIVEPIENTTNSQSIYNSLFNFGKTQLSAKPTFAEPKHSGNPYALNLKDSNLFQIPELSDFGSATPSLNHQRPETEPQPLNVKHHKVNSLNLLSSSEKAKLHKLPIAQTLPAQLQKRVKYMGAQQTPTKLTKLDINELSRSNNVTEGLSSALSHEPNSQKSKHQTDVYQKHIFTNRKKKNTSKEKTPLSSEFIQKQLKTYLSKTKESPSSLCKINPLRLSLNADREGKSPKENTRTLSNYTFSPEMGPTNFFVDTNTNFRDEHIQHQCSSFIALKDGGSFILNKSDEGMKLNIQPNKVQRNLLERINQLEAEVMAIKMKNFQVDNLNKNLIQEIKSTNRQQKQILEKNLELEERLLAVEHMLRFNKMSNPRLQVSQFMANVYNTDISLDIQIEPDRQRRKKYFHTDSKNTKL